MNLLASFLFSTPARRVCHVACVALCAATGACTFPDVTYSDAVAPCTVASTCVTKTSTCGKQAQSTKIACEQQSCGGSPPCSMCLIQYESSIDLCVTECEGCGKTEGCANGTAHCEMIANNP